MRSIKAVRAIMKFSVVRFIMVQPIIEPRAFGGFGDIVIG